MTPRHVDVRACLQARVEELGGGVLELVAAKVDTNQLFGNPLPGKKKELRVRYLVVVSARAPPQFVTSLMDLCSSVRFEEREGSSPPAGSLRHAARESHNIDTTSRRRVRRENPPSTRARHEEPSAKRAAQGRVYTYFVWSYGGSVKTPPSSVHHGSGQRLTQCAGRRESAKERRKTPRPWSRLGKMLDRGTTASD